MGMMKMIGNVGRKFRTAYMKTSRPKSGYEKPISDSLRSAVGVKRQRDLIRSQGVADFPKEINIADQTAGNAMKKHFVRAEQARTSKVNKRIADYDAGYPKSRANRPQKALDRSGWETEGGPSTISKKTRVTFKGQDMKESNFMKSFKPVGGYKYGTLVSKEALRTGGKKAVADSYGRKGFKNYKTRTYEP